VTAKTVYGKDSTYWLKKWFLSPTFKAALDGIPSWSTILDLGCGGGRLGLYLASRSHSVYGMDNDPTLIGSLQEQHPEMRWICGDAEDGDTWRTSPNFDWIVSNVCIRKDQCRLDAILPYFRYSKLLLRIQGSKDLFGYVDETPCYSEEEILRMLPGCKITAERYQQRFTSGDYLRSSIEKIGMKPGEKASGAKDTINAPREYLLVKGVRG